MPVSMRNSSAVICVDWPTPELASANVPGFSLARRISDFTSWAATPGFTTSTLGTANTCVTGAKSWGP